MRILNRLRVLLSWRRVSDELAEELASHRAMLEEEYRARGLSPADAQIAARRALGNDTAMRETSRDVWLAPAIDSASKDVRYAWRNLVRSPGFTLVAIASLGIGIGANTAIFSVIQSVLLARLPVPNAAQLYSVRRSLGAKGFDDRLSSAEVDQLRGAPLDIARFTTASASVVVGESEDAESLDAVDGHYFDLIGLNAARGRTITTADDDAAAPVVVVSDAFWKTRMASDSQVVGRVIKIREHSFTIVGVAPPRYAGVRFPSRTGVTIPFRTARAIGIVTTDDPRLQAVTLLGRLGRGQSQASVAGVLDARWRSCCARGELGLPAKRPTADIKLDVVDVSRGIEQMKIDVRGRFSTILIALMGGVAVLLLIACANVGNLLLARAASRRRELAVRQAIGASHGRLLAQLIIESAVLSAFGAVVGLLLARWSTALIARSNIDMLSGIVDPSIHAPILVFTAAISVVSGMVFGVVPAMRATSGDLLTPLKDGGRGASLGRAVLDRGVVAVQLALAMLLVSAAALFIQTLQNLQKTALGFSPAGLFATSVETRGTSYQSSQMTVRMANDVLRAVRAIPGIESAAMTSMVPIVGGRSSTDDIVVPGYTPLDGTSTPTQIVAITPGYFKTAGIAIRRGRDLEASEADAHAVVVNEAFVREFFPSREPMGAAFRDGDDEVRIVGVVADVRYMDAREPARPMFYAPVTDGSWPFLELVVRTSAERVVVDAPVSRAITAELPGIPARGLQSADDAIASALSRERIAAVLAGLFGAVALGLAAVGLYGVMAYQVGRRTAEIGIRVALGARASTVLWMVMRESSRLVALGLVAGIPLAIVAGRAVSSQLYGVTPYSAVTLMAAAVVLGLVAALATLIPARRATRVSPMAALRAE